METKEKTVYEITVGELCEKFGIDGKNLKRIHIQDSHEWDNRKDKLIIEEY